MDVKGALEAFEAIRSTVPEADRLALDAELTTRYGHIAEVAGPVAVATAAETVETPETAFDRRLAVFLNPNVRLNFINQMQVQREFWGALGHELPELSEDQRAQMEAKLEANPTHRIMAAPLLDLDGRVAMADKTREVFPKNKLTKNLSVPALWTPDTSWMFGKLLADPEATVTEGTGWNKQSYGMGYKTTQASSGLTVMKRGDYITDLTAAGKTVEGEHSTPWTLSVMDAAVRSPRTYATAENLHAKVSPTATPEAHIGMQLMHQANGTPNTNWEPDFVNEAVFELDKRGDPKALVGAAGVSFVPGNARVYLDRWCADDRNDDFGVRAEESGISL